jgi:NAD(P)-dependent dehydrogenase (short-subunit alcohol dehydrogenase family)
MAYAPFNLTGKVALVTGGNRGIGYGFAEALSQAGASVAIWGSSEANNAAAVKKLGGKAKAWTVNVADEKQVADAMLDVVKHFGRIDSVFANAGIGGGAKSFAEFPTDTYRRVLSVNLDGVFFTKGAVVSMMKSIAVEHARYGVRANSILPGWIATDMTQGAQDNAAFAEKVIPRVPMRRWGEPKDFGGVAVYLTSDASSYHSGDSFVIDGAYSIF